MNTRELDRPLEADALREIERAIRGKLKALNLSDSFIERSIEDAVQKGLVEYLRAVERGEAVENRNGFVVRAGFCRAIDDLRREAKQADGAVVEAIIDSGGVAEPPTDEVAIDYMQAEQLREAVGRLSPEEQQVLSLHYFEEKTAEASAAALFCSERTYRRRLKQALRKLGGMLDAPVPEPGSELAIEIGVIVWVGLRGAEVALSRGPLDQLLAAAEAVHDRLAWVADRARDLAGRSGSNGGSERIVALASSGPGKAVGTCLAACLLAVGGAELVGVGVGGTSHHADRPAASRHVTAKPAEHKPQLVTAPPVPAPSPSTASSTKSSRSSGTASSSATRAEERERAATASVRSQSLESAASSEETASEPAPQASPPSSSSEPTPNEVAGSQGLESLAP
ncbi:MAG TPA: sigma-70 family RNA polymerase sigma factor [Solirubrobacterales bacterium]|nr:sigma-70 family RNA polymerase sigma factor [Solirubrobacterales bacterium]